MTLPFSRLAKYLALSFASVTMTAQFALAQPSAPDNRPIVRVAVQQISNSGALDPLREQSNVGTRVLPMIYAGLIELDTTGDLKPKAGIAESWKRIDDRTLEFKLRPGVKFHNGDPVTVEDIAFSFGPQRMFGQSKPITDAATAQPAAAAKGAPAAANDPAFATGPTPPPEVVAVARNIWPSLIGIEIVDEKTVRLVNALPDVTLEGRLARLGSEIISKKAYLAAKDWNTWAQNPVSAGPFKVKELKQDQSLVLVANDDYFGGKPNVREIRYTVVPEVSSRINGLISGQYDFVTDIPPDQFKLIQNNPKFEITGGPVMNHRLVVFDKTNAVLANPKIRQAMTHAIDRKAIVDALWGGRTTIPAGLQWEFYDNMYIKDWEVPKYDVALARKLLKEAGYKGEPIPFRTMNNYYTNQTQTDQIMLEMWKAVGLNVQMQMAENWSQIFEKGPMRGIRGWSNSAPFSDPVSSMVNQHGPRGQQQRMGEWSNDEFNKLSNVLVTSVNPQERRETFARMLVIAEREDPAYTVLHRTAVFYAKRKDFGWKPSQTFLMDFRAENLQPPK
jgi:peptide/nickel transport system substrate-binding protein